MEDLLNILSNTQVAIAFGGIIVLSLVENLHPFFDFFQGSTSKRNRHYLKNLTIGLFNALIITFVFSGLWLWATIWSDQQAIGLFHWIDPFLGEYSTAVRLVGLVLLFDLWMYIWHRINHAIPFLWRFHRVHHSDPFMNVTTATRFHAGEIIISSILRIGVLILLGMHLWELLVYEIIAIIIIQFHHANIQIPKKLDKWLSKFIITPSLHKVHHSDWQPETDSNYGTIFTFWDTIFKSLRKRENFETLSFGLKEFKSDESQRLKNLVNSPFKKSD